MSTTIPPLSSQTPDRLARLSRALTTLIDARADAKDLSADQWEFALTLDALYRVGVTEADLRWLISYGLVEQALEKTPPDAAKRDFLPIAGRLISDHSCFVLTQAGCVLAEQLSLQKIPLVVQPSQNQTEILLPCWDCNVRELSFRGCLVKRFHTPAYCQEMVLSALEKARWPIRINNPLPKDSGVDPIHQLRDTVRRLNKNQQNSKIFFARDGTGDGIRWEIA
jgi:hypothetical protein